jgi:hypothetical protein
MLSNAIGRKVAIRWLGLNSNHLSPVLQTRNGDGSRAHEWVKDKVSGV